MHVQVSLCVYKSVHVCTLGIVHKEQCYNDSENLWFTVIGYQFMNCLVLTPDLIIDVTVCVGIATTTQLLWVCVDCLYTCT